jgi:hypothetical protein
MSSMFKKPKAPEPPPPPPLMADENQIELARRRSLATQRQRSGVASTQLSNRETGTATLLGGG